MPWPKEHKAQTRDRIVNAAAAAFRARGVGGVRVEEIMGSAGLTHGGFYAHFGSKDELLGEALQRASDQTVEHLSRALASLPPEQRLRAVIDAYLSPEHAAHPEQGCPVAALGPEVARGEAGTRGELARGIRERLAWMRGLFPGRPSRAREDQVIGTLACMVGGIVLSRALGGEESGEVLRSCRAFLRRALEQAAPAGSRSRAK